MIGDAQETGDTCDTQNWILDTAQSMESKVRLLVGIKIQGHTFNLIKCLTMRLFDSFVGNKSCSLFPHILFTSFLLPSNLTITDLHQGIKWLATTDYNWEVFLHDESSPRHPSTASSHLDSSRDFLHGNNCWWHRKWKMWQCLQKYQWHNVWWLL